MKIERLSPDTMHKNPAYSQVAVVSNPNEFIYVGGQNGIDKDGKIAKDLAGQSVQAFKNVLLALEAAGASMNDVFKMTIYLVEGNSFQDAFAAVMPLMDKNAPPSTVTGILVAGLAVPDYLIEIEAVAAV